MKFFIIFGIIKWIDMFVPRFVASNPLSTRQYYNKFIYFLFCFLTKGSSKMQYITILRHYYLYYFEGALVSDFWLINFVYTTYSMHTVTIKLTN